MAKLEKWSEDEFVSYDEYAYYCNHSADWTERNRVACDKRGVPHDARCPFCQKELKHGWAMLYVDDTKCMERPSRYYSTPGPGRKPVKIGKTCLKAFEAAHSRLYNK